MIRVLIQKNLWADMVEILFVSEQNGKRYYAKPVELVFEEILAGIEIKPTLRISQFLSSEFLKALAEELDRIDIKTDKDAKMQGLLEATKYHLEDMRKLVFKTKKD